MNFSERPPDELLALYRQAFAEGPRRGEVWRHYRGGLHLVLACSLREADHTPLVTYREMGPGLTWTRPLAEWLEEVPHEAGPVPRFSRTYPAPVEDGP